MDHREYIDAKRRATYIEYLINFFDKLHNKNSNK